MGARKLFPSLVFEAEGVGVLGDGAFDLVGGSVWKICLDLDCDVDLGVWVGVEDGNDFLRDLDEAQFRG